MFAWGSGVSGELGMGEEVVSLQQPARVWWGEDEEQEGCCEGLAAGDGFSLFLAGKRLYGCGGDGKSPGDQTGIQRIKVETGEQNETGLQIEGMACGRLHSLLREAGGGALLSMGGGSHGQLGNHFGSPHFRNSPKVVPKMEAPAESCFACGWFHSLACCGPHVYSWGQNHRFQLGHGSDFPANKPRAIDSLSNIPISILAAGLHQSCVSNLYQIDSKRILHMLMF
ncbi:MAG: hypothetical protein Q8P67_27200 [archaeon]|nr:hypothetical protein [archaeon]